MNWKVWSVPLFMKEFPPTNQMKLVGYKNLLVE